MPLTSAQLAALVERARTKEPLVVSPPPPAAQRPVRPAKPALQAETPLRTPTASAVSPPPQPSAPQSAHTAKAEDFPIGWDLKKDSWHFHRRFYAVFRRPMAHGEYSRLLHQIRHGQAEHLGENCWRVTLPGSSRTLPVRATAWRLITILPKNWQPPTSLAPSSGSSSSEPTPPRSNRAYSPCVLLDRSTEPALTRSELIADLAAPHLRVADVELIVATIFDQITGALARVERVELRGFGAFRVKQCSARIGHNPRTGETVQVDEKAAPFFKAGKELRARLNGSGMKRHT